MTAAEYEAKRQAIVASLMQVQAMLDALAPVIYAQQRKAWEIAAAYRVRRLHQPSMN